MTAQKKIATPPKTHQLPVRFTEEEYTNKAILDDNGMMIEREGILMEGVNCELRSFSHECRELNEQYGKNNTSAEVKAHHYIISFDPRDRDENGLTVERAQELGLEFTKKNFPGHQALVCTHPDGHNSAGNIHVHIVINSLRKFDVERQPFMERPCDALAGYKHHVSREFLEYLKKETMQLCQKESEGKKAAYDQTKENLDKTFYSSATPASILQARRPTVPIILTPEVNTARFKT